MVTRREAPKAAHAAPPVSFQLIDELPDELLHLVARHIPDVAVLHLRAASASLRDSLEVLLAFIQANGARKVLAVVTMPFGASVRPWALVVHPGHEVHLSELTWAKRCNSAGGVRVGDYIAREEHGEEPAGGRGHVAEEQDEDGG